MAVRKHAPRRRRSRVPDLPPRYDEVFADGQRWLDSLAGEPLAAASFAAGLDPTAGRRQATLPRTVSPTVRRAQTFLDRVATTLAAKNAAYGDSVTRPLRIFSRAAADEQLRVRIDDKLSRVVRGACGLGDDEDTLLDLVGYLALLAAVRGSPRRRRNGGTR